MTPFCNSRAVQLFAYAVSLVGAWGTAPIWFEPIPMFWHSVFAWVLGSLIFLLFMACLYAIESVFHAWDDAK